MIENDKRAHDLALLYMQLEIKEERIVLTYTEDYKGFVNEYRHLYQEFMNQLETP